MAAPFTYAEALAFLGASRWFGMKPGLTRMERMAKSIGSPQKSLRFLHLAGTNGKGSTAAFAESCLRAHGLRVGLYTSPHLIDVRERIQIDRMSISEKAFAEGMTAVREAITGDEEATFFELMTALALWYFAREKVDWVVWETGLGGRLDATNIVLPHVTLLTRIGFDHQRYLGSTLPEIAREKAGTIKKGTPVISVAQAKEAAEVVRQVAKEKGAPLTWVEDGLDLGCHGGRQKARIEGRTYELGMMGAHQMENAACAVAGVRLVLGASLDEEALARGLSRADWPGRFQILNRAPLIVLDGAHNPAGAAALVVTWQSVLAQLEGIAPTEIEGRAHLIFGAVSDKAVDEVAQILRPLARHVSLVRLASERTAEPADLQAHFPGLPCRIFSSVSEALTALAPSDPTEPVLIAGSLFLAGEVLAHRAGRTGDYQANERLETSGQPRKI